ncbi:MAG: tyrosine-type recombinase/integrase [Terriglobia bacterium]
MESTATLTQEAAGRKKRRERGSGHIFKPKYRTKAGGLRESPRYWIQYYRHGVPYRENTHSDKKTVAERLLRKRLGEIEVAQFAGPKVERVRFEEMATDLKTDYKKQSNRSLNRLERSLAYLWKFFAGKKMVDIGSDLVNRYIALRQKNSEEKDACEGLSTGASNATVNRELAAFKRMFYLGVEQEPPKLLRVPKIFEMLPESDAREGYLAAEQYRRLLHELPGHLRPFVATLYLTGMRLRETLGLRWSEVDWLNRRIHLPGRRTKNKQGKTLKIGDELYQWLDMQRQVHDAKHADCEWVFFGKTGKQIRSPYGAFRSACRRAGILVVDNGEKRLPIFHDFRRTFATDMRRAGVSQDVIMEMGGWRTAKVFERYSIKNESDQEDALRRRRNALVEAENRQSTDKVEPGRERAKGLTIV